MSRVERITNHIKKNKELYLAFFIPFAIMLGVCIARGIYPFGNQCFLRVDMYHQYYPFMMEFQEKLQSGGSFLYSWNLGLGSDFVGLYAYYLASPMNWFVFLLSDSLVIEFMTLLILIKVALCGFSFAYYLRNHFQTRSLSIVLFAVFYALSAFACAYNWNIMWMDGIWLAPLIVLGLERLVNENKCGLYYVTLALSIFSNFYISIMICIFLVLYYLILIVERRGKGFFKISMRFAGYSLLAGGTSAVLILPEMVIFSGSGSGSFSLPTYVQWYFSAIDELARSCINVEGLLTNGHWPNIYCGCAVLLLIFLYVMNREISWKRKIPRILLLAFFLVSFSNNILTFIWHGLEFPNGLPSRQSFLYIFLLLVVCFETVHKAKGNRVLHVIIAVVLGSGLLVLFGFFADKERVTMTSIIMTGILLVAYGMIYLFYIGKDKGFYKLGCVFAFVLVIVEATVNLDATSISTTGRDEHLRNLPKYEVLLEQLEEQDDNFYRVDKSSRLTKNDSAVADFRSASIFSSLINIDVASWYHKIGMEGGKNYYCYNGATPFSSALLSVKYMFSESALEESPVRTLVGEEDGMYLYENRYSLPLGFMIDSGFEEANAAEYEDTIAMQNGLAASLGATEPLFTEVETEVKTKATIIHVKEDSYVVGYYWDKRALTVTADYGFKTKKFIKCDHVYLLDLGWCEAGTDITLTSPDINVLQIQGMQMNPDSMNTAYQKLSEQTMELSSFTDTSVKGSVNVTKAGKLLLTIPADEGWSVYVDGEEIEPEKFQDAFISIPLDVGSHSIELSYQTPNLVIGAIISICCVGTFVVIMVVKRKKKCYNCHQ